MKIVVCTNWDNGKGLQADAELLREQLQLRGHEVLFAHTERERLAPKCDLLIFLETVRPTMFPASTRRWVVPNLEWWNPQTDLRPFEKILCKTLDSFRIFSEVAGQKAIFCGWLSAEIGGEPKGDRLLHVAGGSSAKGTEAVVETWRRNPTFPPIDIVSSVYAGRVPRNATLHRKLTDDALRARQATARFHVQPSEYEGFGHTIWEAMSAGGVLLVPGVPPLGDLPCALKIPVATRKPAPHGAAASCAVVSPADLSEAVARALALSDEETGSLSRKARLEWEAGRRRFMSTLDAVLEMPPRISVVFPAHLAGLELVSRSVYALADQTDKRFEVVVSVDGGDTNGDFGRLGEAARELGIACKVVDSPRPKERILEACRNHARNAGWQAASAPLIAIVDGDFILRPNFVEHVLAEHDAAIAASQPAVFTFCLAGIAGIGPSDWLKKDMPEPGQIEGLFTGEIDHGIFSGFADQMTDPGVPFSSPLGDLPEGMPVLWKGLLEALGGFDEAFGAWGADKEEFIDRVKGCARAGLFEIRLIRSTCGLHQPHERDPEAWSAAGKRRQEERLRRNRMILAGQAWWRTRLDNIRDRLPEVLAPFKTQIPTTLLAPRMDIPEGGQAPIEFLKIISERLKSRISRDRGRCAVIGKWAPSIVRELISKQGDAFEETVDGLLTRGSGEIRQVVFVDVLNRLDEDRIKTIGYHLERIKAKGISIVALEPTNMGGGRDQRPPIFYQRLFGRLSVASKFSIDGRVCTLFCGVA